jgi:hypothetical protein
MVSVQLPISTRSTERSAFGSPGVMSSHPTRLGRQPLVADRVRAIGRRGFSYFPNRFVQDGFFAALSPDEQRLYFLLVLVGDRQGLSFYHYESLCTLLQLPLERYLLARDGLLDKDLLASDGTRLQVLELPAAPPAPRPVLRSREALECADPATIHAVLDRALRGEP